ncbi:MAG: BREX-1 system phosphatase PglZ type B [Chloroflexi bacterium]|nr:BREX-1 system phosphatase PglZ type B [Chloroflexota bacterium]
MPTASTFLDALADALKNAGAYNKNDQAAPAAVLWLDKERQWQTLIPRLCERLPIFTLGAYNPAERTGPAYWLRCVIAGVLPEFALPAESVPIIYLPGVSKQELRAVEDCPKHLQPLAELQYRGVLWIHKNGREWSIAAFLQTRDGGLGIPISADDATREAMQRALSKLADEPIANLQKQAPLKAAFFDALLNPDDARNLLLWLNNSAEYAKRCAPEEWTAFCQLCKSKYGFHPEQDGEITGARKLGERQGAWARVWQRFAEAPQAYPNLPALLRNARPQISMFDELMPEWPQDNERAEEQLRRKLGELRQKYEIDARSLIHSLETENAARRAWVWSTLGLAPLAVALEHLATLAREAEQPVTGATVGEIAAAYTERGWRVDLAALNALAAVERAEDVAAVKAAISTVYRPWLEKLATEFQKAIALNGYPATNPTAKIDSRACILFSDALRFDVAQQLASVLRQRGLNCQVGWHLTALPTITPTAKPAVSPVADKFSGKGKILFDTYVKENNVRVTAEVLRQTLDQAGYQVLDAEETGDPARSAWTELGEIDKYGHGNGWKIAHHLVGELRTLVQRIQSLVDAGWEKVVIITDHGWLMAPDGLPKTQLPEHLTEIRKGRCARLKDDAKTDLQTVPWHWDKDARIAIAPGISCFETGKEYEHGGVSPQECVVPLLTITRASDAQASYEIKSVTWRGLRCIVKIAGRLADIQVDLRSKAGDPATSLASPKAPDAEGNASLLVEDDERMGAAAFVVVVSDEGVIYKQELTTIGG